MICVDNNRIRTRVGNVFGCWSHLFSDCDNRDELIAFGRKIGLKVEWIQVRSTFPRFHFDVTETKRLAAIKAGARSVPVSEFGAMMRARRQGAKV